MRIARHAHRSKGTGNSERNSTTKERSPFAAVAIAMMLMQLAVLANSATASVPADNVGGTITIRTVGSAHGVFDLPVKTGLGIGELMHGQGLIGLYLAGPTGSIYDVEFFLFGGVHAYPAAPSPSELTAGRWHAYLAAPKGMAVEIKIPLTLVGQDILLDMAPHAVTIQKLRDMHDVTGLSTPAWPAPTPLHTFFNEPVGPIIAPAEIERGEVTLSRRGAIIIEERWFSGGPAAGHANSRQWVQSGPLQSDCLPRNSATAVGLVGGADVASLTWFPAEAGHWDIGVDWGTFGGWIPFRHDAHAMSFELAEGDPRWEWENSAFWSAARRYFDTGLDQTLPADPPPIAWDAAQGGACTGVPIV